MTSCSASWLIAELATTPAPSPTRIAAQQTCESERMPAFNLIVSNVITIPPKVDELSIRGVPAGPQRPHFLGGCLRVARQPRTRMAIDIFKVLVGCVKDGDFVIESRLDHFLRDAVEFDEYAEVGGVRLGPAF